MPTVPNLATLDLIDEAWVDAVAGAANFADAATAYTPALTNVTAGTVTGRYMQIGKLLIVHMQITAGTATAAAPITVGLPAGLTSLGGGVIQPADAYLVTTSTSALVLAGATAITVYGSAAGANFGVGGALANTRVSAMVFLA